MPRAVPQGEQRRRFAFRLAELPLPIGRIQVGASLFHLESSDPALPHGAKQRLFSQREDLEYFEAAGPGVFDPKIAREVSTPVRECVQGVTGRDGSGQSGGEDTSRRFDHVPSHSPLDSQFGVRGFLQRLGLPRGALKIVARRRPAAIAKGPNQAISCWHSR